MDGILAHALKESNDGFRLLFLEIQNHTVLAPNGKKCRIEFFNTQSEGTITISSKPYSTVIIGANGVGKSFLLAAIADIFRYLHQLQNNDNKAVESLGFRFAVHYFVNGHTYKISNLPDQSGLVKVDGNAKERFSCWVDDLPKGLHWCDLPCAVLASSITIADRFRTQKQPDNYYWYLGARNENLPNSTGTKTIVRKAVDAIAECLTHDTYFKEKLFDLLECLDLERKMEIEYSVRYKDVYLADPITEERFIKIFDNWEESFNAAGMKRKDQPWSHNRFKQIRQNPDNIRIMVDYLKRIKEEQLLDRRSHLVYDIREETFKEDWKAIKLLSSLDILSYPKIKIHKKITSRIEKEFLFEDSSSGETAMLCQFINILSRIEHHSLILIDEPETRSIKNNISEHTIIHQKNCCVYCEELMFGGIQLDHIAPKKLHPEYCFEPKNLVSSCAVCNMYVKNAGDTIVGTPAKRYNKNQFTIVHPYFDDPDFHIKYTNADKVVIDYANSTKLGKATIDFFHLNDYPAYCKRARRFGNAKKYPIDFMRLAKETSTYKP